MARSKRGVLTLIACAMVLGLIGVAFSCRKWYGVSYLACVLPGALMMGVSSVPILIGGALATRALLHGRIRGAAVHALGAALAGLSSIVIVKPFLDGDTSRSSTAALVWVWAPLYSSVVLGVVSGLGVLLVRDARPRPAPASWLHAVTSPLLLPVWIACGVLLIGIARYSIDHSAIVVADRSSNPDVLRRVFEGERLGPGHSGVQLFLAMNRATPPDILEVLSQSHFDHVRVHVASNPHTPAAARLRLETDPHSAVRQAASLGRLQWPGSPTGRCSSRTREVR